MYTILGVIAKPMGLLLDLLYGFIGNYGISIIIFTVFVKLCLYPLYIKQTKSTAMMSEMQPKIKALQNKYGNDQETLNIKMQELYKEEKFNPMGGCLPIHSDAYYHGTLRTAQKSAEIHNEGLHDFRVP